MHTAHRTVAAPSAQGEPHANAILLLDNSRSFASMVATAFGERLGLPVTLATSLRQAQQTLQDNRSYFLVFTGLVLADADADRILDFFGESGLPTVVVSGVYDDAIRQKIQSRPIVDCVLKNTPGSIDYLVWLAHRLDRNRRIGALVVDDSPSARSLAASRLRLFGFNVTQAGNGIEALQAIASNPAIGLVITDYEMPGVDGLELVRRLRAVHTRDRLSIIGVSGSGTSSLVAQFLKHGANDFLHKPYSREEFFCRVSQNVDNLDLIGTLQDLATKDFLTGLPNRRHFFERGARLLQASQLHGLAAGMLDIDHFKQVNDTYGHEAGDVALKAVAGAVAAHARADDLPCRFGGEEFALLAPGLSHEDAHAYFERLRARIEAMPIALPGGRSIQVTVSIGVCMAGESLCAMLAEADLQLYAAKAGGRNRVSQQAPTVIHAFVA